jgi:hypothetical protein
MHGRRGQAQQGVDVYGKSARTSQLAGVQCKGKDNFADKRVTEDEVRSEVRKALTFQPPLSEFTIATTGPKDANIELVARTITAEHLRDGKFSVTVAAWEDIVMLLNGHDDLIEQYCNVQTSTARIVQALSPKFNEINQRISETIARPASQPTTSFGIRQTFDTSTELGREMQFQHDAVLAVARNLHQGYPDVSIVDLPWPNNNLLMLEFPDGISLRVHVLARFHTAATDVEVMTRFIEHIKSGGILTQELIVFVTGEGSFRHLKEYFQRFPRYGTPVAIATLTTTATIKDWHFVP